MKKFTNHNPITPTDIINSNINQRLQPSRGFNLQSFHFPHEISRKWEKIDIKPQLLHTRGSLANRRPPKGRKPICYQVSGAGCDGLWGKWEGKEDCLITCKAHTTTYTITTWHSPPFTMTGPSWIQGVVPRSKTLAVQGSSIKGVVQLRSSK